MSFEDKTPEVNHFYGPVPVEKPAPVPAAQAVGGDVPVQYSHDRVEGKPVKQSRDRAQYVRQQKGHSLTLHLIFGALILWVNVLYISVSPNHYWHA